MREAISLIEKKPCKDHKVLEWDLVDMQRRYNNYYAFHNNLYITAEQEFWTEDKEDMLKSIPAIINGNAESIILLVKTIWVLKVGQEPCRILPLVQAGKTEIHLSETGLAITKDSPQEWFMQGVIEKVESKTDTDQFFARIEQEMKTPSRSKIWKRRKPKPQLPFTMHVKPKKSFRLF